MEILIESDVGLGQESLKLLKDTNQQQIPTERGVEKGEDSIHTSVKSCTVLEGNSVCFRRWFLFASPLQETFHCKKPCIVATEYDPFIC